jgi:hypothetical protein
MAPPINYNESPQLGLAHQYIVTAFDEGLTAAQEMIDGLGDLAADVTPDYRNGLIQIPASDARFRRKQGGLRANFTPTIGSQTVTVERDAFEIRMTMDDLEDNKFDAAVLFARQIAARVKTRPVDLLRGDPLDGDLGILGGLTAVWEPDGQFYFDTDHLVDWEDPGGTTWANLSTLALNRDNYRIIRGRMFDVPDQGRRPRALRPTHFLVGSALESQAKEIAILETLSAAGQNPDYDSNIKLVIVPEFNDGQWMLASANLPAKETPFGYWLRSPFEVVYKGLMDTDDGEEHIWRVEGRDGLGFQYPWRAFLNTP